MSGTAAYTARASCARNCYKKSVPHASARASPALGLRFNEGAVANKVAVGVGVGVGEENGVVGVLCLVGEGKRVVGYSAALAADAVGVVANVAGTALPALAFQLQGERRVTQGHQAVVVPAQNVTKQYGKWEMKRCKRATNKKCG